MKKSSFIFGTILLALVNFIVRSIGFVYRIILSRAIGAEAIGLYQMVFPFLMVLITIPTAGIPVAISKLVAKENSLNHREGVFKILNVALWLGGLLALVLSVFVSLKIDYIATNILKNNHLYYPILWIIPAIALITFANIIRGFFYGLKDMQPPATAQIIEQIARIVFVLLYLFYKKPNSPVVAATIAIIGISIGEFFGLLYLVLRFYIGKSKLSRINLGNYTKGTMEIFNSLLFIAVPITISRLIATLIQSINSILIPQRLQVAGYSAAQAVSVFGKISGMAMPLLYLPFTVTSALVINIIPNISEQLAVNNLQDVEYKSNLAMKMTLLIAIPTTITFATFGNHLAELIYGQEEVGRFLSIISYATIFLCMQHTLSGILHGMGKQVITTVNYLLGMIIQLYCTYYLVPNPEFGINGFFIGFLASSFTIFILNLITLRRHIRIRLPFVQAILKPTLCSLFMIIIMLYTYKGSFAIVEKNSISTIISSMTGLIFYFGALIASKTLDAKYLMNIFKG